MIEPLRARMAALSRRMSVEWQRLQDFDLRLKRLEDASRIIAGFGLDPLAPKNPGPVPYLFTLYGVNDYARSIDRPLAGYRVAMELHEFDFNDTPSYSIYNDNTIETASDSLTNAAGQIAFYGLGAYNGLEVGADCDSFGFYTVPGHYAAYWAKAYNTPGAAYWTANSSKPLGTLLGQGPTYPTQLVYSRMIPAAPYVGAYSGSPYPVKRPWIIGGATFPTNNNTWTQSRSPRSVWGWNGFTWVGALTGSYNLYWTVIPTATNLTLTAGVYHINPGGGDKPVDAASEGQAGVTFLSSTKSPSSYTGDGSTPNWVGTWSYDFTGSGIDTLTGITTITLSSS